MFTCCGCCYFSTWQLPSAKVGFIVCANHTADWTHMIPMAFGELKIFWIINKTPSRRGKETKSTNIIISSSGNSESSSSSKHPTNFMRTDNPACIHGKRKNCTSTSIFYYFDRNSCLSFHFALSCIMHSFLAPFLRSLFSTTVSMCVRASESLSLSVSLCLSAGIIALFCSFFVLCF